MGRKQLTDDQKLIAAEKRREYRRNWMASRSVEKKATDAQYLKEWKANHFDNQQIYVEDYQDRSHHYWSCRKDSCNRCDAVADWNKDRIAKGMRPSRDVKKE